MRIIGALTVVLVLAGCAAAPDVEPAETTTPAPVLIEVSKPTQVFDGDCSKLFSDAALSEALGQPLEQPWQDVEMPAMWVSPLTPQDSLVEHAGGVTCLWAAPLTDPEEFTGVVLLVSAVPAAAVSAPEDEVCRETDISATSCPIDATANGIRLSGLLTSDLEGVDPRARVAAVEAVFVASATAAGAPVIQPHPAGSWDTPTDCATVAAALDFAALGETNPVHADSSEGTDAYASVVEDDLRGGRRLYECTLLGDNWHASFMALGGGAWARDAVLAQDGAEAVEVPGFDLVVTTPFNGGLIDFFDGVNWLQVSGTDPAEVAPTVHIVIDALNAIASD